jgi:hypothetical protein
MSGRLFIVATVARVTGSDLDWRKILDAPGRQIEISAARCPANTNVTGGSQAYFRWRRRMAKAIALEPCPTAIAVPG